MDGRLRAAVGVLALGTLVAATTHGRDATAAVVAPAALSFASTVVLGPDTGGEPSIQDDGHGHVYVTSPTGIASALVNDTGVLVISSAKGGGSLWRSVDGGHTFLPKVDFGTANGGGDTDVTADASQTVHVIDLEAAAADTQTSTDHGVTFTAPAQTGPDDDREWLTPVGNKLFLTYHDFALNVDLIFVSTDGGQTFLPAGTAGKIINPVDNPTAAADCVDGNLLSKPVTDSAGNLYVLINCSTAPNQLAPSGVPLDRLYMAISKDGGMTFHTVLANDVSNGGTNPGSWGHVFNQLGIDAAGNLFIAVSGDLKAGDPYHMYLIRSLDHGATWLPPIALNSDHAQTFPAIATGQAGQVAVGYYGTTVCQAGAASCNVNDIRTDGNIFQFYVAQTLDATDPNPVFTTTQLTSTSPHQNGICTDGIFCGTPLSAGGNRNLADFESMTVDPQGHLEVVIPADPTNIKTSDLNPTVNWFFRQTGGPLMPPGATNGNGTGNQTYTTAAVVATPAPTPAPATGSPTPAAVLSASPNTSGVTSRSALASGVVIVVLAFVVFFAAARRRRRGS